VKHNLKTRGFRPRWYLCAASTATQFIFLNSDTIQEVIKTPADGWSEDDAESFHNYLMGWETVSPCKNELR